MRYKDSLVLVSFGRLEERERGSRGRAEAARKGRMRASSPLTSLQIKRIDSMMSSVSRRLTPDMVGAKEERVKGRKGVGGVDGWMGDGREGEGREGRAELRD